MNMKAGSEFLVVDGKYDMELWSKRKSRHVNGTCRCYIRVDGKVIGGSGEDCEYSKLNGQQQQMIN